MESERLSAGGRLICPFLRPNFISRRQYDSLVKTGESLIGAIDRMEQMVLEIPALLARLELLPAEKMLAGNRPRLPGPGSGRASGFPPGATGICTSCSTMPIRPPARVMPMRWPISSGIAAVQGIPQEVYPDPRRRPQASFAGAAEILQAVWRQKKPNIAIVEFRPAYHSGRANTRSSGNSSAGGLSGGNRFAGAARISQRRTAQGLVRNRPGLSPAGRAGVPDSLRSLAIRWCRPIATAPCAWSIASAANWRTRRPCSGCSPTKP